MKSRAEELIDEVKDDARSDMGRVRKVVDHLAARPTLELELIEEMASALGRVEKRLRDAVNELRAIDPERELARYRSQRTVVLARLRDLVIQRESLHFPPEPRLADQYGIPPAR